jgi:hypothetical protein
MNLLLIAWINFVIELVYLETSFKYIELQNQLSG